MGGCVGGWSINSSSYFFLCSKKEQGVPTDLSGTSERSVVMLSLKTGLGD